MKKYSPILPSMLAIALSLIPASPGTTQSGNMSDITGPNTNEIDPDDSEAEEDFDDELDDSEAEEDFDDELDDSEAEEDFDDELDDSEAEEDFEDELDDSEAEEDFEDELDDSEAEEDFEDELNQMDEELDDFDGELNQMDEELDDFEAEEEFDGALDDFDEELDDFDGALDDFDEELDELDGELNHIDVKFNYIDVELNHFNGEFEEPEANLIDQVPDEMEYPNQMIDLEHERIEFEPIQIKDFNQASFEQEIEQGEIEQAEIEQAEIEQAEAEARDIEENDIEENDIEEREERGSEEEEVQEIGKVEQEVDRPAYEAQLQQVDVDVAVQLIEEYQAVEFSDYLGVELFGEVPSFDEISATLYELWQVTGQKAAFVYVSASNNQLDMFTVVPSPSGTASSAPEILASTRSIPGVIVAQTLGPTQHLQVTSVKGKKLRETIKEFRHQITDPRHRRSQKYLLNAQQLYQWLIAPMSAQLEAEEIDILVLSMDSGLRSLPIGALHDGEQFLIEKYGLALVPSFGLTDVSYSDVRQTKMLAMGASIFPEQNDLPAVPIEMQNILRNHWQGQSFMNEEFTIQKFRELNQQEKFGIIHLATHGEFYPGNISDSYIQFYDQKLNMIELREMANELGWSKTENTPIELLVLSACRTAVGSPEAELGFAGLALQAGVKSALASLWYVSDAGTLGLMSEFYQRLGENPIKSQALRQTQIAMLKGDIRIENGRLRLSNGETLPLTPELAAAGNVDLSHPYFWSAFMMIGNWN